MNALLVTGEVSPILNVYDPTNATHERLVASKVVDITQHCRSAPGTILMRYARTQEGPIVEFDAGPEVERFRADYRSIVDSMGLYCDFALQLNASRWGIDYSRLLGLIVDCSPEHDGH